MDKGKEQETNKNLKVIKGGKIPQEIIEVEGIGDYKTFHPSNRRRLTDTSGNIIPIRKK